MRALIVDDEAPARARLRRLLGLEGVTDILEAQDASEARRQLGLHGPDVIFLDVQMPGSSGMELAAGLEQGAIQGAPQVVFTTAHDAYAVPAFDTGATDYLLKPFDAARLRRALERVRTRLPAPRAPAQLLVPVRDGSAVIAVADIAWIETADNYVVLHTPGARPLLRRTLAALLQELSPGFVRCHRRAAVQVAWIERVLARAHGDCELLLRDGSTVPCSRQYRAAVMAALR